MLPGMAPGFRSHRTLRPVRNGTYGVLQATAVDYASGARNITGRTPLARMKTNKNDPETCRDADERHTAWGTGLRARYDDVAQEPMPDRFRDLLKQLEDAESRQG